MAEFLIATVLFLALAAGMGFLVDRQVLRSIREEDISPPSA